MNLYKMNIDEKNVIFFSIWFNLMYIVPKPLSLSMEILLIVVALKINRFHLASPVKWYGLFLLILLVRNIWNIYETTTFSFVGTSLHCLVVLFLSSIIINNNFHVQLFFKAVAISGLFLCLYLLPSVSNVSLTMSVIGSDSENSYLSNSINLGYSFLLISLCGFSSFIFSNKKLLKLLFISIFFISTTFSLLVGARKSFFGAIILVLIFLLLKHRKSFVKLIMIFIFLIFAFKILFNLLYNNEVLYHIIGNRFEGLFAFLSGDYIDVDASTQARHDLIENYSNFILDNNLIFGPGIDYSLNVFSGVHPHNDYLSILAFGGCIALLSFYSLPIKLLFKYRKLKFNNSNIIMIGLLCSLLFTEFSATVFNISYVVVLYSIIYLNYEYSYGKH